MQCINLRTLFIVFPNFAYARQDPIPSLVSPMWKMLSALPSPNLLEEFQFKITLHDSLVGEYLTKLGFFESPNCLDKLQGMFPNLKLIKMILPCAARSVSCGKFTKPAKRGKPLAIS